MLLLLFTLVKAVIDGVKLVVDLLPDWDFPIIEVAKSIEEIVNFCGYILPMDTLADIFALTVAITGFRLILAIVNKVMDILEVL